MLLKNYFKFLFKRSTVFKFFVLYCFLICSTIYNYDNDNNNNFFIRSNLLIAENNSDKVLEELISVLEKRIGKQEAINIVKQQYLDQIIKDYSDISSFKFMVEHLERTYGKATVILLLKKNFLLRKYLIYKKNFTDIVVSISSFMDKESFLKFIVSCDDNIFTTSSTILCSNLDIYKKYFSSQELTSLFFKRINHLSIFSYTKNIILELEQVLPKIEIKTLLSEEAFYEILLHDKKIYEILNLFNTFMDKDRLASIIRTNGLSYFNTSYYRLLNPTRTLEIMKIAKKYLKDTDCLQLLESEAFIRIFCYDSKISLDTFENVLKILCIDEDNISNFYLYPQGIVNIILDNLEELNRTIAIYQHTESFDFIYDFKYKKSVLNKIILLLKYDDPSFEMIENPDLKIFGISFQEFYSLSYDKFFNYLKTVVTTETYNLLDQNIEFSAYIDSLSLMKLEKFKLSTFILYKTLDTNLFNKIMLNDYKNILNFLKYFCSILSKMDLKNFYILINNPILIEKIFYLSSKHTYKSLQDFNNILDYLSEILTTEIFLNYLTNHLEDLSSILQQYPNKTSDLIQTLKETIINILKTNNKDTVFRILNSNPDKLLQKSTLNKLFNIKDCTSLFSFFRDWNIFKIFG